MTEFGKTATPWHLWVVGVLSLLWNSVGGMSYTTTRLGMLADLGMTADQIAYFDSYPIWANTFWALGVWGAIATSVLLLLRSKHAVTAAWVSIIGLLGTSLYQHVLTETPASLQNWPLVVAIWGTTLLVWWYALRMRSAGVLS